MRTKRAFKVKQKGFFIIFKGVSVAKNHLRPESAPLRNNMLKLKQSFRSTNNGKRVCLMFLFSLWNKISEDLNFIIINVSITVSCLYTFSLDFLSESREWPWWVFLGFFVVFLIRISRPVTTFTGKDLRQSLFFNKVECLSP